MFTIHNQKFGFEIEFSGISKRKAVEVLKTALNGTLHLGEVKDERGRNWKIVYDGSVNRINGGDANELVSPPLMYEDMDLVQNVVRSLRRAGAKIDSSMGMHVHVDVQNHNAKTLKNLVKFYAKYENMFYKACEVLPNRSRHYAMKLNSRHPNLVQKAGTINDLEKLKKLWYGRNPRSVTRYDGSRYSGLNLHNIWYKGWYKGTVEFRLYNSTLHAGKVRTYITLSLAISARALNARSISNRNNEVVPDEFLFPKVLAGMGISSSDEITKNVYKHLVKTMRAPA